MNYALLQSLHDVRPSCAFAVADQRDLLPERPSRSNHQADLGHHAITDFVRGLSYARRLILRAAAFNSTLPENADLTRMPLIWCSRYWFLFCIWLIRWAQPDGSGEVGPRVEDSLG